MNLSDRILWACATVVLLMIAAYFQHEVQLFRNTSTAPSPVPGDFATYYVAGLIASGQGNGMLYCPPTPGHDPAQEMLMGTLSPCPDLMQVAQAHGLARTMRYIYPPFFASFISPLSRMKPRAAYFVWRELSFGMLLGCVFLIVRWFRLKPSPPAFILGAVGAFSFFPVAETFYTGQVDIFIFLLWVLGLHFVQNGSPKLSAICFAVGTIVKLTPAIVVPVFVIRRQWKWLAAYGTTLIVLLGFSVWHLGWENHQVFASKILPGISRGAPVMQGKSIASVLHFIYLGHIPQTASQDWGTTVALTRAKQLVGASLYLAVLVFFWKRAKSPDYLYNELVILALVGLLVAPLSWRHHYVLALLPLLYLWITSLDSGASLRYKLPLLLVTTVAIGTPVPDYLSSMVHHHALQIILASVCTAAALSLLAILMQDYSVLSKLNRKGPLQASPALRASADAA